MRAMIEAVLSLLSVVGLLTLGWLCFGRLLSPAGGPGVKAVVPGRGEGEDLEQAVIGLLWLRGSGLLGGKVVILDCGLTAGGRALAEALCRRDPGVVLWDAAEPEKWTEPD